MKIVIAYVALLATVIGIQAADAGQSVRLISPPVAECKSCQAAPILVARCGGLVGRAPVRSFLQRRAEIRQERIQQRKAIRAARFAARVGCHGVILTAPVGCHGAPPAGCQGPPAAGCSG